MIVEPLSYKDLIERIEVSGYRLTDPRAAVVRVVALSHRILSPIEIYDLARKVHPRIGLVTVYRTLEKLEELGLVQRAHQVSGCSGYIASPQGHQHLLLCRDCGRAEYFGGDDLVELVSSVEAESDFTIDSHWLQFVGFCQDCR